MSDLLDLASDDGGTPLGFGGETVVRRARSRRRRQQGVAIGLTAVAVAGVVVLTQVVGPSRPETGGPAVGPSTRAPDQASSSPAPRLGPQERAIVARCARASMPPSGVSFSDPDPGGVASAAPGTRDAGFLRSWVLDAHLQDPQGVTATFVNTAHTRWATCQLADGGSDMGDEVVPMGRVPTGPIPQSWYGPDGFRHQATEPNWAQVCSPGEGKVCSRELFAGAFARYAGVAAARVDAPDGTVLTPVFGDYTYVFRHTETRVDPHRPADDMQALPSMPVTLLDGQGNRIIRYDYFPSYVIPDSCPSSGGC